ncbi:MAG: hypothetical protein EOM22_17185 [Gammaproteobacteria bacterium]|nr:hypothetical protein [Gammaproteobacteria bacterium]
MCDPTDADRLSYALVKQVPSMYSIETDYGTLDLDDELREAVRAAVEPILRRRLQAAREVTE